MAALPEPAVIAGAFDRPLQPEPIANTAPLQDQRNDPAAIQGWGQQMNQSSNAMQQQINTMQQQLNGMQQQINDRLDRLESRQTNFEIAAVNARLFAKNTGGVLQQLYDIRDGGGIHGFPATQPQLYTMDGMSFIPLGVLC